MTKKILESKKLEQEARERLQTSPLRLQSNQPKYSQEKTYAASGANSNSPAAN